MLRRRSSSLRPNPPIITMGGRARIPSRASALSQPLRTDVEWRRFIARSTSSPHLRFIGSRHITSEWHRSRWRRGRGEPLDLIAVFELVDIRQRADWDDPLWIDVPVRDVVVLADVLKVCRAAKLGREVVQTLEPRVQVRILPDQARVALEVRRLQSETVERVASAPPARHRPGTQTYVDRVKANERRVRPYILCNAWRARSRQPNNATRRGIAPTSSVSCLPSKNGPSELAMSFSVSSSVSNTFLTAPSYAS